MPLPDNAPSNRPPARFNPAHVRRSTIAIPLREEIEQELADTERFLRDHPDVLQNHNTAVFHREDFPGGVDEARRVALDRLQEAVAEVEEKLPQLIDPPDPKLQLPQGVCLARLSDRVVKALLAIDSGEDQPAIRRIWPSRFDIVIDINLNFKPRPDELTLFKTADSRVVAQERIKQYITKARQELGLSDVDQDADDRVLPGIPQYVFARLEGRVIRRLVQIDQQEAIKQHELIEQQAPGDRGSQPSGLRSGAGNLLNPFRAIHHIWPDFKIQSCITQSIATVKADAAHRSFTAFGQGIRWGILDSGIQGDHPHFRLHQNVDPSSPYHADFTAFAGKEAPLKDEFGHGTHVAGIIAGEQSIEKKCDPKEMVAVWLEEDESEKPQPKQAALEKICGMAPQCELVSLKVLDRFGQGTVRNVIAALTRVQEINHQGRELHIHGVNLSLGYPFDAKWFACGHSPICVEVNRLVRSGVVVVIAAGNGGYGTLRTKEGDADAPLELTINDPGNAEGAITVGSTHRDMPHLYGVSYFSSKGPTGDGRYKPDLLAPGERIISCAAAQSRLVSKEAGVPCNYFEQSGTSMAAPHVSGVIAALLSIRPEFIGETDAIKKIFTAAATDLGRARYFQGSGLVDLMRAIQSI